MKLSRSEKQWVIALAGISLLVLGLGTCYHLAKLDYQHNMEREQQAANRTFELGETAELDSDKDQATVINGEPYEACFDWKGAMSLTINNAKIYRTRANAEQDHPDGSPWLDWTEDQRSSKNGGPYLAVDFTVSNLDARPTLKNRLGHEWFNITFLLSGHDLTLPAYFDGMPKEASNELEFGYYYVAPGNSSSYTVIYKLPSRQWIETYGHLSAGVNVDAASKYCFDLGLGHSHE